MKTKKKVKEPSVTSMSKELGDYLKKNNLDPDKDWTNDPVHGKKIKKLMQGIRVKSNKKMHEKHVEQDEKKALKEKAKAKAKKKLEKPKDKVKPVTKQPNAYDYPQVNGEPMPQELRKKYRTKMRRLLKANTSQAQAEKMALEFVLQGMSVAKTTKPEKTKKEKAKAEKVSKPSKEKKAKKKKVVEED